jgi:hypothetical protein
LREKGEGRVFLVFYEDEPVAEDVVAFGEDYPNGMPYSGGGTGWLSHLVGRWIIGLLYEASLSFCTLLSWVG